MKIVNKDGTVFETKKDAVTIVFEDDNERLKVIKNLVITSQLGQVQFNIV